MSGTSFDGVDAALIETDGHYHIKFLDSVYVPYSKSERKFFMGSILKSFKDLTKVINNKHKIAIERLLKKTGFNANKIDLIGVHGQTFFHRPKEGWTWQYISVEGLMKRFKTNFISDFRLNDINNGGEGAPLVPIFHAKISKNFIDTFPLAILNIGGVCNATIIKRENSFQGYDVGPGNGPLDALVYKKLKTEYDRDGDIAKYGKVDKNISKKILIRISKLSKESSYDRKELDELCIYETRNLKIEDALITIINTIADLVYKKLKESNPKTIILVGGGRKNLTLKKHINKKFKSIVLTAEDVGWDGDSLEAQAFGYLAVRSYLGLNITYPKTTGVKSPISGGVLHTFNK